MFLKIRRGSSDELFPFQLKPSAKIHIMGICGTAMSALAGLLKEMGYEVSGSDQNAYPPAGEELKRLRIPVLKGYTASRIPPGLDLIIVGNVISRHFPATQALLRSQIPYISLPTALNHFVLQDKKNIMVCGTHGKTTIACLSACMLRDLNAGFMIGGVAENFKKGFHLSPSPWFVLEGDEYDTAFFQKTPKFIHYHFDYVLLNNIEFDHADIYQDMEAVQQAFRMLIKKVVSTGAVLIAGVECPVVEKLIAPVRSSKVVTYGQRKGDWRLLRRSPLPGWGQVLLVQHMATKETVEIKVPLAGEHNAMNVLAVWVLSRVLKQDKGEVLSALKGFLGARRRFQVLGTFSGRTLIEDFAHHPTAVSAVLRSVREMYPQRRVLALFEPRSNTSQRNIFQKQYEKALSLADMVFCLEAHKSSSIPEKNRFSARQLVDNIRKQHKPAFYASSAKELSVLVQKQSRQKDIIVIMSNGDFGGLIPLLEKSLKTGKS